MLGFDEGVSIDYFGEYLKGLYLSENDITDALRFVYEESADIERKLNLFDENLKSKANPKLTRNFHVGRSRSISNR